MKVELDLGTWSDAALVDVWLRLNFGDADVYRDMLTKGTHVKLDVGVKVHQQSLYGRATGGASSASGKLWYEINKELRQRDILDIRKWIVDRLNPAVPDEVVKWTLDGRTYLVNKTKQTVTHTDGTLSLAQVRALRNCIAEEIGKTGGFGEGHLPEGNEVGWSVQRKSASSAMQVSVGCMSLTGEEALTIANGILEA